MQVGRARAMDDHALSEDVVSSGQRGRDGPAHRYPGRRHEFVVHLHAGQPLQPVYACLRERLMLGKIPLQDNAITVAL